jgi:hypothetical protein
MLGEKKILEEDQSLEADGLDDMPIQTQKPKPKPILSSGQSSEKIPQAHKLTQTEKIPQTPKLTQTEEPQEGKSPKEKLVLSLMEPLTIAYVPRPTIKNFSKSVIESEPLYEVMKRLPIDPGSPTAKFSNLQNLKLDEGYQTQNYQSQKKNAFNVKPKSSKAVLGSMTAFHTKGMQGSPKFRDKTHPGIPGLEHVIADGRKSSLK